MQVVAGLHCLWDNDRKEVHTFSTSVCSPYIVNLPWQRCQNFTCKKPDFIYHGKIRLLFGYVCVHVCVGYVCIWGSEDKSGYRSSDAFHSLSEAGPLTSLQLPCSYRLVGSCYSRDSLVSAPYPAISGIYKHMPPL